MDQSPYESPREVGGGRSSESDTDNDPFFKAATFTVVAVSWVVMWLMIAALSVWVLIFFFDW